MMNMNTQDQTPEDTTLPEALAPPSEVGAQTDSSEAVTDSPAAPVDDADYRDAVRSMRRAKLPDAAIDAMDPAAAISWYEDYRPVQSGIDQAFQRTKELEKEIETLRNAQATPGNAETEGLDTAQLEELGIDPKIAEYLGTLIDSKFAPMVETQQQSQQQAGEAAYEARMQTLQQSNPTLSDPRVRLKVREKAEQLYGAYGDSNAALLDAVAIVTGGMSAQAPNVSKNRGQPSIGVQSDAAPTSTTDDIRALAREIARKYKL